MPESQSSPLPHIPTDADNHLTADVACIRCGYNLRTLSVDRGRCPECELAVGRSVQGHWLRYCDPHWLARIWWGTNRFAVALLCMVVVLGLSPMAVTMNAMIMINPLQRLLIVTLVIFLFAGIGFFAMGFWWASTPDPDHADHESMLSVRRLMRTGLLLYLPGVMLVGMVGASIGTIFLPWGHHHVMHSATTVTPYYLAELVPTVAWGWMVGLVMLLLWYMRSRARRIPDHGLAWACLLMMLGYGLSNTALLVMVTNPLALRELMEHLITSMPTSDATIDFAMNLFEIACQILGALAAVTAVITHLGLIGLLICFWLAFRRQARWAQANWAATLPSPQHE